MNVTLVKYGRTVKRNDDPKCFEFERVDVEAMPLPGQTPDELFAQVRGFVETKLSEVIGTGGKEEKPKKAEKKPDPTAGGETGQGDTSSSTAKPSPEPTPAKSKKTSAKAKAQAAQLDKEKRTRLQYAIESESLQELHDRLVSLSEINNAFTIDEWQAANQKVAEVYRKLEKTSDTFDVQDQITELFRSNKNILEERKRAAA
jgi:hypothetical protein